MTGGFDQVGNNGRVNIGRIRYDNNVIVGDVTPYRKGNAQLFLPYRKVERTINIYELLVYDKVVDYNVRPRGDN